MLVAMQTSTERQDILLIHIFLNDIIIRHILALTTQLRRVTSGNPLEAVPDHQRSLHQHTACEEAGRGPGTDVRVRRHDQNWPTIFIQADNNEGFIERG